MERGEIVETNTDSAIDRVDLDAPLLIFEARNFREYLNDLKKEKGGLLEDPLH